MTRPNARWVAYEERAPHPHGEPVVPRGPWEHARLEEHGTDRSLGDAWFTVKDQVLSAVARLSPELGDSTERRLLVWVGHELFGPGGFTLGYYEDLSIGITVVDLDTGARFVWSWREFER